MATTMMSSRGPMMGMNSGMRSMGEAPQMPAMMMAILARLGTWGSLRSRRTVVRQSGMNAARSRRMPGGSRRAAMNSSAQLASHAAVAMASPVSQGRMVSVAARALVRWFGGFA